MKDTFLIKGFAKLEQLLEPKEVAQIKAIYDTILADKTKTAHLRSDLAGGESTGIEKITQIMRPSRVESQLAQSSAYQKALNWAKQLLGEDIELDFDMLINKAPYTDTPTPWHQDAAYWINLPDKRAVSCWIALDEVTQANGCMWFISKENQAALLPHQSMPKGGALYCTPDSSNAECIPLHIGGCTFHDGFTLHFSKGNTTASQRRALILNFRPKAMIELERQQGVDHTGERKVRNEG